MADLKDKKVVINDYRELPNRIEGNPRDKYLLISLSVLENDVVTEQVVLTSNSKVIEQILKQAKSLPVTGTVRQVKTQSGPWSYWTIE